MGSLSRGDYSSRITHARRMSRQLRTHLRCRIRIYFIEYVLLTRSPRLTLGSLVETTPRRFIKLGLPLFVCMRFQDLFHSPSGVLFAFPSRYWCTIGRLRVFSLGGWSPHLQTGFLVSRPTCRIPSSTRWFSHTGLSPARAGLSSPFC